LRVAKGEGEADAKVVGIEGPPYLGAASASAPDEASDPFRALPAATQPAGAQPGRAFRSSVAAAADPERQWRLDWPGGDGDVAVVIVLALEADVLLRPEQSQQLDNLVRPGAAVARRAVDRGPLGRHVVANTEHRQEAAVTQVIKR